MEKRRNNMSVKDGKDYLYLIWKSEQTRKQYIIGQLTKNGQYEFQYDKEVYSAIDDGFKPLLCFPDLNKVYKDDRLFTVFTSRLPDKKRKNIQVKSIVEAAKKLNIRRKIR